MNQDTLTETWKLDAMTRLEQMENRLQARLGGRIRSLRILLHVDGIVLRGLARTYHAKQVAQHAVMSETQLPILANEIDVT